MQSKFNDGKFLSSKTAALLLIYKVKNKYWNKKKTCKKNYKKNDAKKDYLYICRNRNKQLTKYFVYVIENQTFKNKKHENEIFTTFHADGAIGAVGIECPISATRQ